MFVDLLNSYNYLMVNMSAIKIFGLKTAVYCAELLNVYKKAYLKKKLVEDKYFEVNRKFITEQTSITEEDQLKCDASLRKINLINNYNEYTPNLIYFDYELFASLITSEDMKFIKNISKTVNVKDTKEAKKKAILENIKGCINSDNQQLNGALSDWIDAVYAKSGWAHKSTVEIFQEKLHEYTKGDLQLALKLVEIATVNGWKDCQWAINSYEQELKYKASKSTTSVRTTKQKKATVNDISENAY